MLTAWLFCYVIGTVLLSLSVPSTFHVARFFDYVMLSLKVQGQIDELGTVLGQFFCRTVPTYMAKNKVKLCARDRWTDFFTFYNKKIKTLKNYIYKRSG